MYNIGDYVSHINLRSDSIDAFRFGRVAETVFTNLGEAVFVVWLDKNESVELWTSLVTRAELFPLITFVLKIESNR